MNANIGNVSEEKERNTEMRNGEAKIINRFGFKLLSLYIRHRIGNDPNYEQSAMFYNVEDGQVVGPFEFVYEIGDGSWYDYWYIKIVTSESTTYKNKEDFHCSVRASDDGKKVTIIIYGDKPHFTVEKTDSESCSCNLNKV